MPNNRWIAHVKKYQENHPGISYKEAMQMAKESYNKVEKSSGKKKGGMLSGGMMSGGMMSGGKVKRNVRKPDVKKRGRPQKMKMKGGNIFNDITQGLGAVAPFLPFLI
jgi:hypothetical protein